MISVTAVEPITIEVSSTVEVTTGVEVTTASAIAVDSSVVVPVTSTSVTVFLVVTFTVVTVVSACVDVVLETLVTKVLPVSCFFEEFTLVEKMKSTIPLTFVGKLKEETKLERRNITMETIISIAHWHVVSNS